MAQAPAAAETVRVSMSVTPAQKRELIRRARESGQSLSAYVRKRVFAPVNCEEEVFRFMVEELSAITSRAKEAVERDTTQAQEKVETPEEQHRRIAAGVRASLKDEDIETISRVLTPPPEMGGRTGDKS